MNVHQHLSGTASCTKRRVNTCPVLCRQLTCRCVGAARQEEVYGVGPEQLRVFIHYHPQFYHLHVHFTRAHVNPGCEAERAHLLTDVIQVIPGTLGPLAGCCLGLGSGLGLVGTVSARR